MAAKRKGNTLNIINGFFGEQIEVDKSIYSNEKLYENVTGKNYILSLRKILEKIGCTQEDFEYTLNGIRITSIYVDILDYEYMISNIQSDVTSFILKTVIQKEGSSHIFLIILNMKEKTYFIIDTVNGGEFPYDKNRIEKVLKDMTADKIDFTQKKLPYKFSLQESESKENGLCQVWSLFFIYYYMTGKIEEIFTKFSDIQRMIDRKILDYSVFTEILRTWLYLHTEIKISRKKLHLRIKKSKKSKSKKK
jgi:hypothetical protein